MKLMTDNGRNINLAEFSFEFEFAAYFLLQHTPIPKNTV